MVHNYIIILNIKMHKYVSRKSGQLKIVGENNICFLDNHLLFIKLYFVLPYKIVSIFLILKYINRKVREIGCVMCGENLYD